jgi:hypothetical protein
MFDPFSAGERRRHQMFLSGACEIRIGRADEAGLWRVSHADQPARQVEVDVLELERIRGQAMKLGIPVTTCRPHGEPGKSEFMETTRIDGRFDSRATRRPSCQHFVENIVDGSCHQRRLISAAYHWDGRAVSPAVISGGEEAYRTLGVLGSQALRTHDENTGVSDLALGEPPHLNRSTYSGADEVHVEELHEASLFRRAGQPYRLSVSAHGGEKVSVCFLTGADLVELRSRLDETMLVIHQDGKPSTQRGWDLPDVKVRA